MDDRSPSLTPVPADALPDLSRALVAAGLPAGDVDRPGIRFWSLSLPGGTAYGGLEGEGADLLLRSVVVPEGARGTGAGRMTVTLLEDAARALGGRRLWLLTTTAAGFFEGSGYRRADRGEAPGTITASAQFAGLCPASATCMVKEL